MFLAIGFVSASDNNNTMQNIDENTNLDDCILENNVGANSPAEWYVNSSKTEDGDGSSDSPFNNLNRAVSQSKDGDTIYIAPGTYNGSGRNVNLSIEKSLSLINSGNGDVIFDGNDTCQIFNIAADSFNICGLTFTHGKTDGNGGAVYFANGLKNSVITADFIENNGQLGGAIYFNGDIINNTFTGSFIQNLANSNGGAILVNGISNCNTFSADFRDNKGKGHYGGAIYFTNNSISDKFFGNFINNYIVEGSGGGIVFDWNVSNAVFAANFSNNYVTHFPSAAFEVYGTFYNNTVGGYFENNCEAAVLLSNCVNNTFNATFINNTARFGSIFSIETSINNYFACTFINNTGQSGAALYIMMDIINTTIEGTFINNTATNLGGAIAVYPYLPGRTPKIENFIINAVFINNTATNKGGAIYMESDCGILINASVFEGNSAKYGGAIYSNVSGAVVDSCVFNNNAARRDGAGIYSIGNIKVEKTNFTNNHAKHYGGGIFSDNGGEVTTSNFISNTGDFYAGGIYFEGDGTVSLSNFTGNVATQDAGGIYFNANGTVTGSNFMNNKGYDGGAIYANKQVSVSDSKFKNNKANQNGGAILFAEKGSVDDCSFANNTAYISGGAIASQNLIDVDKSDFEDNNAYYGGAISDSGDGNIVNSNFIRNNASSGGALIINGNMNISNNIFKDNTATDGTNDVELAVNSTLKKIVELKIIKSGNVIYGESVEIVVNVTCEGNLVNEGEVYVTVNDKKYSGNVSDGIATVKIPNLNAGTYNVDVTFDGGINYTNSVVSAPFTVSKKKVAITAKNRAYVINYGGKYSVSVKCGSGQKVTFTLNGKNVKTATTNAKGIATIQLTAKILKTAKAGVKKLVINVVSDNYQAPAKTVKITVNKEKTRIVAKQKTFKKALKVKKYTMTLKNSKGKAMKKALVTLKVKGKTYKAKTNSYGKATFKITKLTKQGTFVAKITFKGNAYYKNAAKKTKIKII